MPQRGGGSELKDALSILLTVDGSSHAVDSAAKRGTRLKDALSILRTADSLGGAVNSTSKGGGKME